MLTVKGSEMQHSSSQILQLLALETAWDKAVGIYPTLESMTGSPNSIREAMAEAIVKAAADGCLALDVLVDAALACLPNRIARPQA